MKSKDELLGDYRALAEEQAKHKDAVFLEVLIDIRDVLTAPEKQSRTVRGWSDFFAP